MLRPYRRTWAESFFAYWGYFSEKEIARRRSLRLQGLDPEFEGLTWGHRPRRRRTRKTKNQRGFLSYFMGRDEEVFFEYQDQTENGRLQRFLDFVLNKIGFLHFEDIEEPNDVLEEETETDVTEEEEASYVTIPSESFVNFQHQHEAFEDSYSFEATEGHEYDDEELEDYDEEEDDHPTLLVKDNSCLGAILILTIPLLLLFSTLLLDNSWSLPVIMDWSSSLVFHAVQSAMHAMILCTGWISSALTGIGNVQLFVNLIFILYARWRFKTVCLQTKLASLAIRKESNF